MTCQDCAYFFERENNSRTADSTRKCSSTHRITLRNTSQVKLRQGEPSCSKLIDSQHGRQSIHWQNGGSGCNWSASFCLMAAVNSGTLRNTLRSSRWVLKSRKKRSTMLSHDTEVGVKCM